MARRIMVGLFLAATLSGCGGNGLSNPGPASGTATVASSATATATPIIRQEVPASTVTVGSN